MELNTSCAEVSCSQDESSGDAILRMEDLTGIQGGFSWGGGSWARLYSVNKNTDDVMEKHLRKKEEAAFAKLDLGQCPSRLWPSDYSSTK